MVSDSSSGIDVTPSLKEGDLNLDVSDCLDLVPTLAYFLAHIKGRHTLSGIENLVHKESDRLSEVRKLLSHFERSTDIQDNSLIIEGHHQIIQESKNLVMPEDHRMVMVGTLFLLHHHGGTIYPAEAVNKSYPGFFEIISSHSEMNKSEK